MTFDSSSIAPTSSQDLTTSSDSTNFDTSGMTAISDDSAAPQNQKQTQNIKTDDFDTTGMQPIADDTSSVVAENVTSFPTNQTSNISQKFPLAQQTKGGKVKSGYGIRKDPISGQSAIHRGLDIPTPEGTPLNPAGSGTVVFAGEKKGYGNYVSIQYDNGVTVSYGHLSKINVEQGDKVSQEAIIGFSGNTGKSTGPHVHIRAQYNGQDIDPDSVFSGSFQKNGLDAIKQGLNPNFSGILQTQDTFDVSGMSPISDDSAATQNFDVSGMQSVSDDSPQETQQAATQQLQDKNGVDAASLGTPNISAPTLTTPRYLDLGTSNPFVMSAKGAADVAKFKEENPIYLGKPKTFSVHSAGKMPTQDEIDNAYIDNLGLTALNNKFKQDYAKYNPNYQGNINIAYLENPQNAMVKTGPNQFLVTTQPRSSTVDLINAYAKGGMAAYVQKYTEIQKLSDAYQNRRKVYDDSLKQYAIDHPYLNSFKKGLQEGAISAAQLDYNLSQLPDAIATMAKYGAYSKEYDAVIAQNKVGQGAINQASQELRPSSEGNIPSVFEGIGATIPTLPQYMAVGELGGSNMLPILVYLEHAHQGNRKAMQSAFTMAAMAGAGHGFAKFLDNPGINIDYPETFPNLVNKVIGGEEGASFVYKGISPEATKSAQSITGLVTGRNVEDFTRVNRLTRQLLLRGTNALVPSTITALSGGTAKEIFSSAALGLAFPVGSQSKIREIPTLQNINPDSPTLTKPIAGLGAAPNVEVPLGESSEFTSPEGGKVRTLTNVRTGIPPESPRNLYSELPDTVGTNLQTGFEAKGTATSIQLPYDTAALHVLELQRVLDSNTFANKGDSDAEVNIKRVAIQNAIDLIKSQLPPEMLDFAVTNEDSIRTALRTNYEAQKQKAEFLLGKKVPDTGQVLSPDTVSNSIDAIIPPDLDVTKAQQLRRDLIRADEAKVAAKNALGTKYSKNTIFTQDKVYAAQQNTAARTNSLPEDVTNELKEKGIDPENVELRNSGVTKDDFIKAVQNSKDLLTIAAGGIEDFYRRGIEPNLVNFKNRLVNEVGQKVVDALTPDGIQTLFNNGKEYIDKNNADIFFSPLKQTILEKLPNKFTKEQALAVIGGKQFDAERKWISGKLPVTTRLSLDERTEYNNLINFANSYNEFSPTQQARFDVLDAKTNFGKSIGNVDLALDQFQDSNGKINKSDLIKFINDNQIKVDEVVKDNKTVYPTDDPELVALENQKSQILRDRYDSNANKTRTPEQFKAIDDAANAIEDKIVNRGTQLDKENEARYTVYGEDYAGGEDLTTHGGKNYTEIIMTLPTPATIPETRYPIERDTNILRVIPATEGTNLWRVEENENGVWRSRRLLNSEELAKTWADNEWKTIWADSLKTPAIEGQADYTSSHWQGVKNPIIHFRINDYNVDGIGRVGLVQEVQSDRIQQMREAQRLEIARELSAINSDKFNKGLISGAEFSENSIRYHKGKDEFSLTQAKRELEPQLDSYPDSTKHYEKIKNNEFSGAIKSTPFMEGAEKDLALKRLIRYAAEKGYDGITFTSAEMQQERYNKLIEGKNIAYRKNTDGSYQLQLLDSEDNLLSTEKFTDDKDLRARLNDDNIATKIINGEGTKPTNAYNELTYIDGANLKIGKGYGEYDTKFPNDVRKIGKKFGMETKDGEFELGTIDDSSPLIVKYNGPHYYTSEVEQKLSIISKNTIAYIYGNEVVNIMKAGNSFINAIEGLASSGDPDALLAMRGLFGKDNFEENVLEESNKKSLPVLTLPDSLKQSVLKEGQPLFGLPNEYTSQTNPLNKNQPIATRNRIVSSEIYNDAKNNLVNDLAQIADHSNTDSSEPPSANNGVVFNSGLNPEAFIDQAKLLYKGVKDFQQFATEMVSKYGPRVQDYLKDIWNYVQQIPTQLGAGIDYTLKNWEDISNNPVYQMMSGGEKGSIGLFGKKLKTPEAEDYLVNEEKHQSKIDLRFIASSTGLSQINPKFGEVYQALRSAGRTGNSYLTEIGKQLKQFAQLTQKPNIDSMKVVDAIYTRNQENKDDPAEDAKIVQRFNMSQDEANAYFLARGAQGNILNIRLAAKEYLIKERAKVQTAKLVGLTRGTPEHDAVLNSLLNLSDALMRITNDHQRLKDSGYISLVRDGKIAGYAEDPTQPLKLANGNDNPAAKFYNHFDTLKEADDWLDDLKTNKGAVNGTIYDVRNPVEIKGLLEKIGPQNFEDIVDRSGANPNDPEIQKLRDDIYSRFPTKTYELDREFIRGYDRTPENILNTMTKQAQAYSSSYYAKVGGGEALKALDATGIRTKDNNLYRLSAKYINDEVTRPTQTGTSQIIARARNGVYVFQLGFDFAQLWLHQFAKPIHQTYSYFGRVENPDTSAAKTKLTGAEPEKYMIKGFAAEANYVREKMGGKAILDRDYVDFMQRMEDEHVIGAEYTKSLIEREAGIATKADKAVHWMSIFQRAGEKGSRIQAASAAYYAGKEAFNLSGDDLANFVTKAVDATQSNPSRGDNPYIVRGVSATGNELGKLLYQFQKFHQMWWENLGLNIKSDMKHGTIAATARHLIPMAIMGGISGLPFTNAASSLYTFLTGKDAKQQTKKILGNSEVLNNIAWYGITGSEAVSNKLGAHAPVLDQFRIGDNLLDTIGENFGASDIPAISTGSRLVQGLGDVFTNRKRMLGVTELTPRFLSGSMKAIAANEWGIHARNNATIEPAKKVTIPQTAGMVLNITPNVVEKYYGDKKTKALQRLHRKL